MESFLLPLGKTTGEIDSAKVRIYDRDRTICDVLRNMSRMDREIFNKAIQGYVHDTKKNIPDLMQYARKIDNNINQFRIVAICCAILSICSEVLSIPNVIRIVPRAYSCVTLIARIT